MLRARERVFHVERVQVELKSGEGSQLSFYVIECRYRTTTDVIGNATPAQRGPISDTNSRDIRRRRITVHKLFQCLQTIKDTSRASAAYNYAILGNTQHVAFFVKRRRHYEFS